MSYHFDGNLRHCEKNVKFEKTLKGLKSQGWLECYKLKERKEGIFPFVRKGLLSGDRNGKSKLRRRTLSGVLDPVICSSQHRYTAWF